MALFWTCFLLSSCCLTIKGFLSDHAECQHYHNPSAFQKAICGYYANHNNHRCNNIHQRDHVNQLWKDWHKHGDDNVVKRLYYDITNHLNGNDDKRSIHCEAYIHHDTTPSYNHIRHLAMDNDMNGQCRIDIIIEINAVLQIESTHLTTIQAHHTHTHKPTTQAPKSTTQNKVSATTSTSNKTLLNVPYTCNKFEFFTALLHNSIMNHSNAGLCSDGTHTRSEALLIDVCNVPIPSKWTQGLQVVPNCQHIPQYSPIGMFVFGQYPSNGNELSGILVECIGNGFRAAFQLCGHGPKIVNLTVGHSYQRQDANSYYVIS